MKNILLIKMSSLGDIIHTLPALAEAKSHYPDYQFDWVVEESFAPFVANFPMVREVIPIAIRRWRKNLFTSYKNREIPNFIKQIKTKNYDLVLDAQGLWKSSLVSLFANSKQRVGLDYQSARETLASFFYLTKIKVAQDQHAIMRIRQLFASALEYDLATTEFTAKKEQQLTDNNPYIIFFHATTWPTKHWPIANWQELARIIVANGYSVKLPFGNEQEKKNAEEIATNIEGVEVLPKSTLQELQTKINLATAVVAVDTGLGHLSAFLGIPSVSIYGSTDPNLTGTLGANQLHIVTNYNCAPCKQEVCALDKNANYPPCMREITPNVVWDKLKMLL